LNENNPSDVAPSEQMRGIFYYLSHVRIADIIDGTSNTAFFSEKLKGQGTPDARTSAYQIPAPTTLAGLLQACQAVNPLTGTPLTTRQGASWVMGEMCCTSYNHVYPPNKLTCAGVGFSPNNMRNMPMQVPPTSYHAGGVNMLFGDGTVRFVKETIDLVTWQAIGTRNGSEVLSNNF
jgi:prepilin-type processing-associated H-X9-DG protein